MSLQVFAFSPAWGLPSSGPFALKLLAWLKMSGIEHEVVYEDDTRKGPKGKNPWIVADGQAMGDSQLIIAHLGRKHGVNLDEALDSMTVARALAARRMVEEHLHQIFEYELLVHDVGFAHFSDMVKAEAPPVIGSIVSNRIRSHFRRQLIARGVGRHSVDDIAAMGRDNVDALETMLGDSDWFFADHPTTADCAIFGQLAPLCRAPIDTPVCSYARSRSTLTGWVDRVCGELFEEPLRQAA